MELISQYVQAIQAVIAAGANVRMVVGKRSIAVLSVEIADRCLRVGYITAASPEEQELVVSLSTVFTVVFDDWPQEVVQRGWLG